MPDQAGAKRVATLAAAGLSGFAIVYSATLLLRAFSISGAQFGLLVQFLLSIILLVAIATGGMLPVRAIGYDWGTGVLASLGAHLIAMMLVFLLASYAAVPDPYTLILVLGAGLTILLPIIHDGSSSSEPMSLILLATASLSLFAWYVPAPGFVAIALAWLLLPIPGAFIDPG